MCDSISLCDLDRGEWNESVCNRYIPCARLYATVSIQS